MTESIAHATPERLGEILHAGQSDRAAIIAPENGAIVTYGGLAASVEALAGRLATAGVRRGDRVAFVLPNGPDLVQVLLAITALGAAAAPLNPAYTESEFSFYLKDIEPRIVLVSPTQKVATQAASAQGALIGVLASAEGGPPALTVDGRVIERLTPFEEASADDVGVILHTSGTTSRPKQVPLRQRNLMASVRTIGAFYELGEDDVSYCAMPLFHIHGIVASALAALGGGGATVVPSRFTPHRFWPQARASGVTWVSAGPTLHQMILDKVDAQGAPQSLRFTRSCSSALSPALMAARAEQTYGVAILQAYGMTEASHQMASNPRPPAPRYAGSVGVPTGTEIGIVDHELHFLPEGTPGEVVIRGPGVTSGYVNNPDANSEAFFDGWFRTGDQGVLSDGYLRLEGRLKEMILRGGENISPAEIEEILLGHPSVTDAVCFGVEDEKYGEVVAAVTLSGDADDRALTGWCRERLAAFEVPEIIHVLDAIPRTPTGKVQRRRVAEFIANGANAG